MDDFNFEESMLRIEEIEEILSVGKVTLSETLVLFKESTELVTLCAAKIREAELIVEEYKKNFTEEVEGE